MNGADVDADATDHEAGGQSLSAILLWGWKLRTVMLTFSREELYKPHLSSRLLLNMIFSCQTNRIFVSAIPGYTVVT